MQAINFSQSFMSGTRQKLLAFSYAPEMPARVILQDMRNQNDLPLIFEDIKQRLYIWTFRVGTSKAYQFYIILSWILSKLMFIFTCVVLEYGVPQNLTCVHRILTMRYHVIITCSGYQQDFLRAGHVPLMIYHQWQVSTVGRDKTK